MNILFVAHEFRPQYGGGVWVYMYDALTALRARGHHVFIFCRKEGYFQKPIHWEDSNYDGISVRTVYYNSTRSYETSYSNQEIDDIFKMTAKDFDIQIIHIHHLMNLSSGIIPTARNLDIPVITTLHDFWFICHGIFLQISTKERCAGPGLGLNCQRCNHEIISEYINTKQHRRHYWINRISNLLSNIFLAKQLFFHFIRAVKWMIHTSKRSHVSKMNQYFPLDTISRRIELLKTHLLLSNTIIAPSEFIRTIYSKNGVPTGKIKFIPHGIKVSGSPHKPDSGKIRLPIHFAFVGTIHELKGTDVLIEAFATIPPEKAILNIFGDGNPKYISDLSKATRNAAVHFHGKIDHDKIFQVLSQNHVMVVPSICYESFSIVTREAFHAGCPVIASDIGALAEAVRDNVDGFLFKSGDASSLRRKIEKLIYNPDILNTLRKGIRPVKSVTQHAQELEHLYSAQLLEDIQT